MLYPNLSAYTLQYVLSRAIYTALKPGCHHVSFKKAEHSMETFLSFIRKLTDTGDSLLCIGYSIKMRDFPVACCQINTL